MYLILDNAKKLFSQKGAILRKMQGSTFFGSDIQELFLAFVMARLWD